MPFQIKDFNSITLSQINHARAVTTKITDFQPGSVSRTLMEAPAVEIEELYLQMFLGLRDAIPVATFLSFGFDKLPKAKASGWVSVSRSPAPTAPIVVPVGTIFSTADGRDYESTSSVTWAAGESTVRIPVIATVAGVSGNVAAGVIVSSPFFGSGYTVSNSLIVTGRDSETEPEREARFAEYIRSLSRGTVEACLYAASLALVLDVDGNIAQYVARKGYEEIPGRMKIYIYSSSGLASPELLDAGQRLIDGYRDDVAGLIFPGFRAAGVRVDVLAMAERAVPLGIQVEMLPGYTITPAVVQSLNDIFGAAIRGVPAGGTLYQGTLIDLMLAAPNVRRIVPVSTDNIVCSVSEALTPGALTITPL